MTNNEYELIYQKVYPDPFLHGPVYGRRPQLCDLWPSKQEEFKKIVDLAKSE